MPWALYHNPPLVCDMPLWLPLFVRLIYWSLISGDFLSDSSEHVPWCMLGLLTHGLLWSLWQGKCSLHSRCISNPNFLILTRGPCPKNTLAKGAPSKQNKSQQWLHIPLKTPESYKHSVIYDIFINIYIFWFTLFCCGFKNCAWWIHVTLFPCS